MRYVHVAGHHRLPIPTVVGQAGAGSRDIEARVLAMLSARGSVDWRGSGVAATTDSEEKPEPIRNVS